MGGAKDDVTGDQAIKTKQPKARYYLKQDKKAQKEMEEGLAGIVWGKGSASESSTELQKFLKANKFPADILQRSLFNSPYFRSQDKDDAERGKAEVLCKELMSRLQEISEPLSLTILLRASPQFGMVESTEKVLVSIGRLRDEMGIKILEHDYAGAYRIANQVLGGLNKGSDDFWAI